jgi:hypothetical protein
MSAIFSCTSTTLPHAHYLRAHNPKKYALLLHLSASAPPASAHHPPLHFFFNPKTSFAPKTPKPTTPIHPLHWNPTPKPNSWNQILQILEPNPPNRDRSGSLIAMELSKVARNEAHASAHQSEPNSLLSLSRQNLARG